MFDPRNLAAPLFFAVVATGQVLDLLGVLGFWHAIWPRRRSEAPVASVRGRGSFLVLSRDQPIEVIEQTLQAAVAVRRRHRVFLADPSGRPELRWLAGWYGVKRLSPGMEELGEIAGARFLAVVEAGQAPRPDYLERLLPYFADRELALVRASFSRGRERFGVAGAILRGGQTPEEAGCLGSNYVLRRSALHSIGGLGAGTASLAGAMRMEAGLRARGWRTRYVGELVADSLAPSGLRSRLADGWGLAAARLAVAVRPGGRSRGARASASLHAAWATFRSLSLVGLPVSALGVVAYATTHPLPAGWLLNLAVHLLPFLAARALVRLATAPRRLPEELPTARPAQGPAMERPAMERPAAAGPEPEQGPEAHELFELVPELRPELHLGWKVMSTPLPDPGPAEEPRVEVERRTWEELEVRPEPEPVTIQAQTPPVEPEPVMAAIPAVEPLPLAVLVDEPRPRTRRPELAMAAAWIVTLGVIGAAALAVIQTNPPRRPAPVPQVSTPPYSYYSPVEVPAERVQSSR